ncbi:hypothetical protein J2809_001724 [Arthrobacter pascens]|nr:hypothetical protein [Arthrobacter pascens]
MISRSHTDRTSPGQHRKTGGRRRCAGCAMLLCCFAAMLLCCGSLTAARFHVKQASSRVATSFSRRQKSVQGMAPNPDAQFGRAPCALRGREERMQTDDQKVVSEGAKRSHDSCLPPLRGVPPSTQSCHRKSRRSRARSVSWKRCGTCPDASPMHTPGSCVPRGKKAAVHRFTIEAKVRLERPIKVPSPGLHKTTEPHARPVSHSRSHTVGIRRAVAGSARPQSPPPTRLSTPWHADCRLAMFHVKRWIVEFNGRQRHRPSEVPSPCVLLAPRPIGSPGRRLRGPR